MPKYTSGVVNGPGAGDAFFQLIRAHLLANGWTEYDVLNNAGPTTRDIVFASTPLDAVAGNCGFLRIKYQYATTYYVYTYADWDPAAHAGVNETTPGSLTVQDASFFYWMRANPYAIAILTRQGNTYRRHYYGLLRRGLPAWRSGLTKTTQAYAVGAQTVAVASDMTGKLFVGQRVAICNFAHSNASANKANAEHVVIQTIAPGALTFTTPLTKAYDAGAFIGQNPLPVGVGDSLFDGNNYFYAPRDLALTYTTAASQAFYAFRVMPAGDGAIDPADDTGEYALGAFMLHQASGAAGKSGIYGYVHHLYPYIYNAVNGTEDLLLTPDGKSYLIVQATASYGHVMGPREEA